SITRSSFWATPSCVDSQTASWRRQAARSARGWSQSSDCCSPINLTQVTPPVLSMPTKVQVRIGRPSSLTAPNPFLPSLVRGVSTKAPHSSVGGPCSGTSSDPPPDDFNLPCASTCSKSRRIDVGPDPALGLPFFSCFESRNDSALITATSHERLFACKT